MLLCKVTALGSERGWGRGVASSQLVESPTVNLSVEEMY